MKPQTTQHAAGPRERKIRQAWREASIAGERIDEFCPVGWMSDEELEAIALRVPRKITIRMLRQSFGLGQP